MEKKRRKTKLTIIIVILLITIFGFVLAVGFNHPAPEKNNKRQPRLVKTLKVSAFNHQDIHSFPAKVQAPQETQLAFRVGGQLHAFPVKVGQFVKKNQIIARLDDRDYKNENIRCEAVIKEVKAKYKAMLKGDRVEDIKIVEAELKSAQATMKEAEKEFHRKEKLLDKKVISANEFEDASARYEIAKATVEALKQRIIKAKAGARPEDIEAMKAQIERLLTQYTDAKNSLKDTILKAPYDCYIAEKHVDNFDSVDEKEPIVTILDCQQLEVRARVPEEIIAHKNKISKVECDFDVYPGTIFEAIIHEIGCQPVAESQTYLFSVLLNKDTKKLNICPGMSANLKLFIQSKSIPKYHIIPTEAVVGINNASYVWLYNDLKNLVNKYPVKVIGVDNQGIKVEGLRENSEIVIAGAKFLTDQQQVKRFKNLSVRNK